MGTRRTALTHLNGLLSRWRPRLALEPVVAGVLLGGSLLALLLVCLRDGDGTAGVSCTTLVVALGLALAVVLAYRYPVHLRTHTKIALVTTVYYLLAVLVPPPLATLTAGVAALAGELSQRSQSGAYASDIAVEVARRMLMVLLGALVVLAGRDILDPWTLWGAAGVLALFDLLTMPLLLAPMFGDRPLRVLVATARTTWLADGVQYLVGVLGAAAASRYLWTIPLLIVPGALIYAAFKSMKEMHEDTRQLLESMADAVDLRDAYTGGHSRRVTDYSAAILKELGIKGPEVTLILSAARVHDIGKIGIPDAVLHKPGRLDAAEWAVMQQHPVHGANLLKRYSDFARGVEIVLHHHESWDGSGYPAGLRGPDIPFGARVVAVADSYDAMTSNRPYRDGMPNERAGRILWEGRGRQWDPAIVDAFLRAIEWTPEPLSLAEAAASQRLSAEMPRPLGALA